MHKVIFVNGPPRSGKDQAGMILKRTHNVRIYKLSRPMKDALAAFFYIDHFMMKDEIEPNKDTRSAEFGDLSWRGIQISFAETWAKPVLGQDILGKLGVMFLKQGTTYDITVITDSGFVEECMPIVKHIGIDNCLLIQLSRDGCTFEGDSRSYIELDNIGVTMIQLHNRYPLVPTDDMPLTYEMQLRSAVNGWLGEDNDDNL